MQMGRWFGYRPGYVDLCRLFTTNQIFEWFNHITLATEEMRNDFDEMTAALKRPKDFRLKVRNHHGLLTITSVAKLHFTQNIEISFSGTNPQTYQLLKTKAAIENNFKALQNLVSALGIIDSNIKKINNKARYLLYQNIDIQPLCDFLNSYAIEQPSIKNATISDYIYEQAKNGKIKEWSICIISNTDDKVFIDYKGKTPQHQRQPNENISKFTFESGGNIVEMRCSVRNQQLGRSSEFYLISKNQIDQTGDRQVDLAVKKDSYNEIKKQRALENKGLLLIYALDERGTFFAEKYNIPIVGYSLHFPKIDDEIKVSYTATINRDFDNEVMDDDDNPENK